MTERDPSRPTPGTSDSESEASIEAAFDGSASAASAPGEAAGPSDEQFEQMFGDLLLEAREGRLSKEEMMQAMTERMQTFQSSIEAGPHTTEQAKRLLSVEMDECVAVLMKDGMPDITEATFATLNSIISGKPSSPEQRAKWPRGLGDVLAADPVATAKFLYDAEGTKAFCLAFASVENARVWVWKMNYEVFMGEGAAMLFVQNMDSNSFRLPENLEMFTRYFMTGDVVDDGGGGLKLRESLDRVGHWEYGHGEGPRQREPLSAWIDRTLQRIEGATVYTTKSQNTGGCNCRSRCDCGARNAKARAEEAPILAARDTAE
jgi:hypothetical protein